MRYRLGFESTSIRCDFADRNPGMFAIVDTNSPFALGECIAIAENKSIATRIVALLNAAEPE